MNSLSNTVRKAVDGNYTSHKSLRKTAGEAWAKKLEFFDHRCYWCGEEFSSAGLIEHDHLTPVSRGGTDDYDNIVPACHVCNLQKGTKTAEEYRAYRQMLGLRCPQSEELYGFLLEQLSLVRKHHSPHAQLLQTLIKERIRTVLGNTSESNAMLLDENISRLRKVVLG